MAPFDQPPNQPPNGPSHPSPGSFGPGRPNRRLNDIDLLRSNRRGAAFSNTASPYQFARPDTTRSAAGAETAETPYRLRKSLAHFIEDPPQLVQTGASRWMIPYADFITVLLGVAFLMLGAQMVLPQANQAAADRLPSALAQQPLGGDVRADETTDVVGEALAMLSHTVAAGSLKEAGRQERLAMAQAAGDPEEEAGLVMLAVEGSDRPSAELDQDDLKLIEASPAFRFPEGAQTYTEAKSAHAEQMQAQLLKAAGLDGQQVVVRDDERGLVISFQERLFFPSGQATLTNPAKQTLAKLAGVLKGSQAQIVVEGHTDNTPIKTAQYPSNWELSMARATTIVRQLIDRHGFSPDRMSAKGYGEFKPLADNSTIEGKQKNRRVDIVLVTPGKGVHQPENPSNSGKPDITAPGDLEADPVESSSGPSPASSI
ncbi:MAG: OmpA family protein [Cyanobacteria bacterium HKST-UBA04]|nr:OmpA family protein [Cyanobacteria bacterium HKST-UBA04]